MVFGKGEIKGNNFLILVEDRDNGIMLNFDEKLYSLKEEFKLSIKTFLQTILKNMDQEQKSEIDEKEKE
jgi:hypothetical protein